MSADDEADTSCCRWSRDFVVAHAIVACGLVMCPVAVLLVANRGPSGCAIFFAAFAAVCTTSSLILCIRFYADLRRPPWLSSSAASGSGGLQQEEDAEAASSAVAGEETTSSAPRATSHAIRHLVIDHRHRAEMRAALAAGRVPSYDYVGGGGAAENCAVCLGEVEKGQTVRQLPACQHVFHRECIDPWLRAHATCPVCRSSVLPKVDNGAAHGQARTTTLSPPEITAV